jgi:hypothetical protein
MQVKFRLEDISMENKNGRPTPAGEVEKILRLLQGFYEASTLGTGEELMTEFRKIQVSSYDHVAHFAKMLQDMESDLRTGRERFEESTGLQIQLMIVYASLAYCADAMRPDLNRDEQWYAVCWAHNYLGRLRGATTGEVTGAVSSIMGRAKNGAAGRHKENREMKLEVFEWLAQNIDRFNSLDSAAEAIAGDIAPIKFRTARDWVGQWKKTQSPEIKKRSEEH